MYSSFLSSNKDIQQISKVNLVYMSVCQNVPEVFLATGFEAVSLQGITKTACNFLYCAKGKLQYCQFLQIKMTVKSTGFICLNSTC